MFAGTMQPEGYLIAIMLINRNQYKCKFLIGGGVWPSETRERYSTCLYLHETEVAAVAYDLVQ